MEWTVARLGGLMVMASIAACGGDEGAPAPGGTGSTTSGVQLELGATGCEKDGDCKSNVCFIDRQKFCTLKCTTENATQVCTAPLSGSCNNKGYCKKD